MSPEEKSLLERTYKMTEENNTILRSIRRSNRFGRIMKIIYWLIILGAAYGLFHYLQPYIDTVIGLYSQIKQ